MIGRWRSHVHVTALARIPRDQWDRLADALADAAHELDEQVMCTGSAPGPIARFEALGYRMRRRAAEALHERIAQALRGYQPAPTETHTILRPRCRCT